MQEALMDNMWALVPAYVSMKDLIATCTTIEDLLKGRQGGSGESPTEYLAKFLNGNLGT